MSGLGARLAASNAPAVDSDLVGRVRRRMSEAAARPTAIAIIDAVKAEPTQAALGGRALLRVGEQIFDEIAGAGPLARILADPTVTDVVVNGPAEVWIDRGYGMERTSVTFADEESLRRYAQRLAASCQRRLDDASPFVDATLPDGTRVHAVLAPIAVRGPYLSLRTLRHHSMSLDDLVVRGTCDATTAGLVYAVVQARLAYLITGGTGTGKTTLLNAMLGLVPATERIVIVEDSAELRPMHPHWVTLQARLANVEGSGTVAMRDLVRQALRMRPDRLVIGECRGAEVVDMLAALNTGHEGGAGTLHANTASDVPARLEALGLLGGLTREALHAQVRAGFQIIVHLRRVEAARILDEICVLVPSGTGRLVMPLTAWCRRAGGGPAASLLANLIVQRGVALPDALAGYR